MKFSLSLILGLAFLSSVVSESYIVTYKHSQRHSSNIEYFAKRYTTTKKFSIDGLNIMALDIPKDHVDEYHFKISYPFIETIEIDHKVSIHGENVQAYPPLHLDRLDQRSFPLDNKYYHNEYSGSGAIVYVVDTGVDISHPEFEGRAEWGINTADDEGSNGCMDSHGTHVAGIVGSKTYGVAKKVKIISVKVLDCNGEGSYSGILGGLEWISKRKEKNSIVNMSLGGPYSKILNTVVESLSKNGFIVVSAAGNENSNACNSSPGSAISSITVGSVGTYISRQCSSLSFSTFSNYGRCVDILADGEDILSTIPKGSTGTMSGTSMASPEVAGVCALYVASMVAKNKCPSKLLDVLHKNAIKDAVQGELNGTGNILLYSRFQ